MTTIEQPSLAFRVDAYPVERERITGQPNFMRAMELALSLAPFDNDKDAARKLHIDSGALSCKKHGQKPWNVEEVCRVMDAGQNLIPVAWLAHKYGHGLVLLETEAERRERALREQIEELRMKNRVLVEAFRGQA